MPWQPFRRKGNKHRPLREDEGETSFTQEMTVPRSYSDGNLVRAPSERLLLGGWTGQSYGTCSGGANTWTSFTSHTVEEGDTLAGLALRFNITIQDLKLANKLWTNEGLWPGRDLRIPHIEAKETSLDLSGSSAASETMSTDSQVSGDSRHMASRDSSLAPSASGCSFNTSPISLPLQRSGSLQSTPLHRKYREPAGLPGDQRTSVEDLSSFLTAMDSCIEINKKASISLIKSSKLRPDQREQLVSQTSLPVDFLSNNNTSNDRTRESGGRNARGGGSTADGGFDNIC